MKRSPMLRRTPDRVPDSARSTVLARAGFACEACGYDLSWDIERRGHSIHHRVPRQMGGDTNPARNSPANLLLLCGTGTTGCHGDIESHRTAAYDLGRLVKRGTDPSAVPVLLHRRGWSLLTPDGAVVDAPGGYRR